MKRLRPDELAATQETTATSTSGSDSAPGSLATVATAPLPVIAERCDPLAFSDSTGKSESEHGAPDADAPKEVRKPPKPFMCPVEGCASGYQRKGDLKYHFLKFHGDLKDNYPILMRSKSTKRGKKFPCPVETCPSGFQRLADLKSHFFGAHSESLDTLRDLIPTGLQKCPWEGCEGTLKMHLTSVHGEVDTESATVEAAKESKESLAIRAFTMAPIPPIQRTNFEPQTLQSSSTAPAQPPLQLSPTLPPLLSVHSGAPPSPSMQSQLARVPMSVATPMAYSAPFYLHAPFQAMMPMPTTSSLPHGHDFFERPVALYGPAYQQYSTHASYSFHVPTQHTSPHASQLYPLPSYAFAHTPPSTLMSPPCECTNETSLPSSQGQAVRAAKSADAQEKASTYRA